MKLGDAIATATKAVGIEPCDTCEKRRQFLNELQEGFEKNVADMLSKFKKEKQ